MRRKYYPPIVRFTNSITQIYLHQSDKVGPGKSSIKWLPYKWCLHMYQTFSMVLNFIDLKGTGAVSGALNAIRTLANPNIISGLEKKKVKRNRERNIFSGFLE